MIVNSDSKLAALPQVEIYTDGGCEPNPSPGGYGVVLLHPKKRAEASGGFRSTTNNRMELHAAIKGLELLKQPCKVTPLAFVTARDSTPENSEDASREEDVEHTFMRWKPGPTR
jgi:RNase H-like protein